VMVAWYFRSLAVFCATFVALASRADAGPPFVTDDPEPTDYRNWEIYSGFQYENDGHGDASARAPFAEFNYGLMPNVQIAFLARFNEGSADSTTPGGYQVTELGIKTRFVQETSGQPQVAFYPSVHIPTAPGERAVAFLPIWLQKTVGAWTTFGGGGVYLNPNFGMRNSTFVGAATERELSRAITVGAELYHQSTEIVGGSDTTAVNVGMTAHVGNFHALLFSVGRALHGDNSFSAYASYKFALGPRVTPSE
jgi:hypothetical protein